MIKLIDLLNEGKQVGPLYHYTENWLLEKIIETNTLLAPVSFTRSKDKETVFWIDAEAALVIDGDKLSTRYKIRPYQDRDEEGRSFDEMEERVDKNIVNLDQYLIKVILYKSDPEIESLLTEKNIEWLNNKGFNTENILNELNIQSKIPIGKGSEQTVYSFKLKPEYIIKKFSPDSKYSTKEKWIKIIKVAQQHPEIFAKIDKVDFDKGYFIQEKLDEKSLTKDGIELYNYLKDNNILYRNNQDKSNYSGLDIVGILYMEPDRMNMLNNTPWEKTLKPKFERLFNKLNQAGYGINDNYLGDLRLTNIGYDKNGEIKILDFNFGEL